MTQIWMKRLIAAVLVLALVLPMVAQGGGTPGSGSSGGGSSGGSSGGGGGGGGHRQADIDSLLTAVKDAKTRSPDKYEELQKLLYLKVQPSPDYEVPYVFIANVTNNYKVTRNTPLSITTGVENDNPLENRRVIHLTLMIKNPNETRFSAVNPVPVAIQIGEYIKGSGGKNKTVRTWPDVPSFSYLKNVGKVQVKVNWSDGYYYQDTNVLTFDVINNPPMMSNFTLTPKGMVRHNDPIEYKANITDLDGDLLNITLHVLDGQGGELSPPRNVSQQIKGSGAVIFNTKEYSIFNENDAGKNFSYYYTFGDGINTNRTDILPGPGIRRGPKLYVDKLGITPESEDYKWWQWYTFNVRVKNQNPEEFPVGLTLFAKAENGEWRTVESKTVVVGAEPRTVYFNQTRPFVVTDASEPFSYRIKFSEYNQAGTDTIEAAGEKKINPKIVPYALSDPIMISNLAVMLVFIVAVCLLIERVLQRGIEAQESSSGKSGGKKGRSKPKLGGGIGDKIASILRRG